MIFLEEATESKKGSIALDTDLIDSGLVDSMNIMALIVFLEEQTGKPIPLEDLDISYFNNVEVSLMNLANNRTYLLSTL